MAWFDRVAGRYGIAVDGLANATGIKLDFLSTKSASRTLDHSHLLRDACALYLLPLDSHGALNLSLGDQRRSFPTITPTAFRRAAQEEIDLRIPVLEFPGNQHQRRLRRSGFAFRGEAAVCLNESASGPDTVHSANHSAPMATACGWQFFEAYLGLRPSTSGQERRVIDKTGKKVLANH